MKSSIILLNKNAPITIAEILEKKLKDSEAEILVAESIQDGWNILNSSNGKNVKCVVLGEGFHDYEILGFVKKIRLLSEVAIFGFSNDKRFHKILLETGYNVFYFARTKSGSENFLLTVKQLLHGNKP
jgi:DNA-binding response OmpR family regulator